MFRFVKMMTLCCLMVCLSFHETKGDAPVCPDQDRGNIPCPILTDNCSITVNGCDGPGDFIWNDKFPTAVNPIFFSKGLLLLGAKNAPCVDKYPLCKFDKNLNQCAPDLASRPIVQKGLNATPQAFCAGGGVGGGGND